MNPYKTTKILRVAVRSLLQQKLRSFLSALGVVCGVMAVVAMISVGEGAKKETVSQIEQLGTRNIYIKAVPLTKDQAARAREHLSRGLNIADLKRIEKGCVITERVGCLREVSASILGLAREISPQVVACSANYAELQSMHISAGRFIASQDRRQKNLVCVLGNDVARLLGGRGRPGSFIRIDDHLFKVVGILSRIERQTGKSSTVSVRNYNEMVFVPLETAGTLKRRGGGLKKRVGTAHQLSEIVAQVARTEDVMAAAELVKRIMEVSHNYAQDYQLLVPLELLKQAERTQRTFNLVLGAIAGISLLVGGIGIMNIMLATVSERTREIGIRRAVGATRRHIIVHFLSESVILTVSGGIIGLMFGFAAVWVISWIAGWRVAISLWGVALPLLMSFLVGIFFGLYPARQAANVDPIVALRHD
ncbi:MAG: ABC transporter permease [Desulfobacterales bacterium]